MDLMFLFSKHIICNHVSATLVQMKKLIQEYFKIRLKQI